MQSNALTVGIFVFDDVEVLDFAGPFEVFTVADRTRQTAPFHPVLISERPAPIKARGNFVVQPHFDFSNAPALDMVLIPGGGGRRTDGSGFGTRLEQHNLRMREWLLKSARSAQRVMSVCSGALILAQSGLLDDKKATTHRGAYGELRAIGRNIEVIEDVKHVDTGKIISSGGISAGIDMALTVVGQTLSFDVAQETAGYMEYDWRTPE
jgi:transcriptional regulator GlxA family with amidase domain